MENVVAKTELFDGQLEMGDGVSRLVQVANELQVNNEADRAVAAEWLKAIKEMKLQIKKKWEPFKTDAHNLHKRICKQEKEMLDPLDAADKTIRAKYAVSIDREKEAKRKEAELLRELARKEAEAKLAEAAEAAEAGEDFRANMSMMEAEVYEQAANTVKEGSISKTQGISTTKTWKIISIDSEKVPVYFMGAELRPVKPGNVMTLICASGGTVEIPGIVYQETTGLRVL